MSHDTAGRIWPGRGVAALVALWALLPACGSGTIHDRPPQGDANIDSDASPLGDAALTDAAPPLDGDAPDGGGSDAGGPDSTVVLPDAAIACGDQVCTPDEECVHCPEDCGDCPPSCGNGSCDAGEDCDICPFDCGACPPGCPNGSCDTGEDCASCPADCGACPPVCPNGTCETGEDCASCPADCGACPPACGNASCEAGESCWSCASDCGACNCPFPVEVVIYDEDTWGLLATAFADNPSFCADYYLSLPALAGDKTQPRGGGEAAAVRARGPRIHPMAEFHWGGWSSVAGSWYDKGVEFRSRMVTAGYDVAAGDTWAINELPSSVRSDPAVRQNVLDLLRGLYEGPPGSPTTQGAVFTVGMGQGTLNFSVYKPNLKTWIEEASFWSTANLYARWWAQEVYTDPTYTCVPGTTTGLRSQNINAYVEHLARLASVGPSTANTAQSYFGRAYTPLMNAVWMSSGGGYGDTTISLDQMKHHVSGQVYAARAWATSHTYPDGRLGFAWARKNTAIADLTELATRLAVSIQYAYAEGGGGASYACSPSGAYTWCQCSVAGAQFNTGWDTFATW